MSSETYNSNVLSDGYARQSTALVCIAASFVAALAAFVIVQGWWIGVDNFFTPIHHDDFTAMVGIHAFDIWQPRPVSSNFLYVLGPIGAGFFYLIYLSLWLACFALTPVLAFRVFDVRASASVVVLSAFAVTAAWLSLAPSVANLQYLGLATNGLSYLFAVLAGLSLLNGPLRGGRLIAFIVCTVLTAFAKEDMVAFLGGIVVLSALRDSSRGVPLKFVLRKAAAVFAFVFLAYALSFLHSRFSGSPWTSGTGVYTLATPFANIVGNALAFWSISLGMRIVISSWFAMLLVLALRAALKSGPATVGDLVAGGLSFALALPYLALPRFADYYAVTFVPLILASVAPFSARIIGRGGFPAMLIAIPALAAITFQFSDTALRHGQLYWYAETRKVSRHEVQELLRLSTVGLHECPSVAVTGVSSRIGPFISGSSLYVNHVIDQPVNWRIQTEAGTITEAFANATRLADDRWRYIPPTSDAREDAACLIAFDSYGYGTLTSLEQR